MCAQTYHAHSHPYSQQAKIIYALASPEMVRDNINRTLVEHLRLTISPYTKTTSDEKHGPPYTHHQRSSHNLRNLIDQ